MLDLKRLSLLVELAHRGTIAAVAESLAYSPSAVSQQLAVLEKEAGVRLLEPVGRRLRLTSAGETLVVHARAVLLEVERAQAALEASRGEVVGTVRLAAFQSAALTLVPEALLELERRFPALRVEVTESEPETALPALGVGDHDAVLGEEYPHQPLPRTPGHRRRWILDDPLLLVAPAGWLRRGRLRLADLDGRPFAVEPQGTTSRRWVEAYCGSAGVHPDVRYTSTDLQVHLRLAERGLAAALLPALSRPEERPGVSVRALPGRPARRIFLATRAGAGRRPALAAVVGALEAVAAGGRRTPRAP